MSPARSGRLTCCTGERAVSVVGGADLNRQLLRAGLVDELHVDVLPVLFGTGLRLFEDAPPPALEKLGVAEAGARTSLRLPGAAGRRLTPRGPPCPPPLAG
jgi:dihydrofolate reductase